MLDRTDFASWQQCIHLYCRGKDNRVNILKSIDEGPFQMRTFREILVEGHEADLHLGPKQPRFYSNLSPEEKERYNADIRATNTLLQGLPKDIYTLINHYTDAKDMWDNVKMLLEGSELTKEYHELQLYDDFEHFRQHKEETIYDYYVRFSKLINDMRNIKMTMSRMQLNTKFVNNMLPEWGRFVTPVKLNRGLRDSNYDKLVVVQNVQGRQNRGQGNNARGRVQLVMGKLRTDLGMQIQVKQGRLSATTAMENGVALDEEKLLFIVANDCDAFDSDVDEAPTAQTMLMANLSSTDPVYDEAGPSYDLDILSEVYDHDHCQDAVCEHHEAQEMHDNVQPNYVVDSHADYTSDSNMIQYGQYVKDNAVPDVQSNVSYVPTDAYMMIINDMHEQPTQHVSVTAQYNVVDKSLIVELATYKEQVKLYKRRAKFELTEKEQKLDEKLRIVITDQEVTYLEEFLDMKALKEKSKAAIGYKNPLYPTRAIPVILHNSEDTLEIDEITRKKINEKIKDPECVKKKVKIAPHDYSKEKVLPTKIQVKNCTHTTFSDFEKSCKKRITLIVLTEGERGFEQTKECYLTKVIPFFKTLKVHFEGIQKALTREIKEMKENFEELEAEVDQHVVNWKHAEIEWKNILIANDNLIADCLSKDVFYIATDSVLTFFRFFDMHEAFNAAQKHIAELESKNFNLQNKIQNDDHDVMVKQFSKHEVEHLKLQLKYQHLKESFKNKKSVTSSDAPTFDSVFAIGQLKDQV
nr:putative zinc finger, CCHC-type [Tanacetum cinerariifolium]